MPAMRTNQAVYGLVPDEAALRSLRARFPAGAGFLPRLDLFQLWTDGADRHRGVFTLYFATELPGGALLIGLTAFCVLFPLWFFRYARSLWLGFDQYFDPDP